jgi:hypothetical protein
MESKSINTASIKSQLFSSDQNDNISYEEEFEELNKLQIACIDSGLRHLKPKSEKIFKINGDISVDEWNDLYSNFLSRN